MHEQSCCNMIILKQIYTHICNIYVYIFQDETKQFLNKLLEFSVYSKDWLSSVLGRPLVAPCPPAAGGTGQVVFRVRGAAVPAHSGPPCTQEPGTSENWRQDASVFCVLTVRRPRECRARTGTVLLLLEALLASVQSPSLLCQPPSVPGAPRPGARQLCVRDARGPGWREGLPAGPPPKMCVSPCSPSLTLPRDLKRQGPRRTL